MGKKLLVLLMDFVLNVLKKFVAGNGEKRMELKIIRKWFTEKSTIGMLYVNGQFECYTLEDKVRDYPNKIAGQTAIWYGTYKVVIDFSQRFQKLMPHILNVPLFEGIRIHPGNTDKDTEGCILPGTTKSEDFVGQSKVAYDKFFEKLKTAIDAGEEVMITISEEM